MSHLTDSTGIVSEVTDAVQVIILLQLTMIDFRSTSDVEETMSRLDFFINFIATKTDQLVWGPILNRVNGLKREVHSFLVRHVRSELARLDTI